jgi:outer membrane protein assembly factor BamB
LKRKILISLSVSFLLFLTSFFSIIQVSAAGESWPTFQYDYLRTGVAGNTGPKTNTLVWKWYSGFTIEYEEGAIPESTALVPAVVDGKVFVGTEENRFVALDEFTGELIWEFDTQGIVRTPPSVADGKVFFGLLLRIKRKHGRSRMEIWSS